MTFVRKDKVNSVKEVSDRLIAYFEIATMTFLCRGERFCDAFILGYVENGDLLKLLLRLRELESQK